MTRLCLHVAPVAALLREQGVHTDYLVCPDGLWTWDGNDWTLEEAMHPAVVVQAKARGVDGQACCRARRSFLEGAPQTEHWLRCDRELDHDGLLHHDPTTGVEWLSDPGVTSG